MKNLNSNQRFILCLCMGIVSGIIIDNLIIGIVVGVVFGLAYRDKNNT